MELLPVEKFFRGDPQILARRLQAGIHHGPQNGDQRERKKAPRAACDRAEYILSVCGFPRSSAHKVFRLFTAARSLRPAQPCLSLPLNLPDRYGIEIKKNIGHLAAAEADHPVRDRRVVRDDKNSDAILAAGVLQ